MAVDKLVDSTKQDACCAAEAAAIIAKGGGTAPLAYDFSNNKGFADAIAAIPSGGITPTGNINITDTNVTDVTNYATAQVVDADLIASNIKKDVNILGVVGSFAGGGGGVVTGTFTFPSSTVNATISHNANINGEYIFLAVMQTASFETLKSSGSTLSYAIAFCALCTASLNDFASGSASSYVNKNGVRWNFTPSNGTFGGGISPATRILADFDVIPYYTPNKIRLAGNFGYHQGTYDFWAIPLN